MPRFRYDIPVYDDAMNEFMDTVVNGFLAHDPLLAHFPIRQTLHGGPNRNVRTPQLLDQPLHAMQQEMRVDFASVRTTDIAAFTKLLYEFTQAFRDQIATSFFKGLMDVTEATGNVRTAQAHALTFDTLINDELERVEISFDEDGRPIFPTLFVHPDMAERLAQMQPTEQELQRMRDIIDRKKESYDAQKRTRRLH